MNTNIKVLRELDELVEAARLLGATQAKKLFDCYTDEDRRFERAMYESIDKHRAALLAERDALAAALEAAQMGLRYVVRVYVLSDEIKWSEEKIDEAVESLISDAKKEADRE